MMEPSLPGSHATAPNDVEGILSALWEAAEKGRTLIEAGEWDRCEVEDSEFSQIVPDDMEDRIIDAMVESGKWTRLYRGFNRVDAGDSL
jgi:hypothetical protein